VEQLDMWANDKELKKKQKLKKLKRKHVEKRRIQDKYNSSDDESHVMPRKITWENIDL
tara:strand:+ start:380 stop:553 length:174 start_codon:yes stop_codon:yes gene_type:complete